MSRAERRRREREAAGHSGSSRGFHPAWIPVGFIAAAFILLGVIAQLNDSGRHPDVRAVEDRAQLVAPERYASSVRAEATYRIAAAIPHVLDGLYCYCFCNDHSDHYSLLDCFASDHAAVCDICMREAEVAYTMTQQGASLAEIRAEVDRMYGVT